MRSSIRVFYIAVFGLLVHGAAFAQTTAPTAGSFPRTDAARDPDVLYRQRADLTSARQAVAIDY
jgi:hypothetical protein